MHLIPGSFILSLLAKSKSLQLLRYEQRGSPEYIKQIIAIGGGPRMGSMMEKYARFKFKKLQNRKKGESFYDHRILLENKLEYNLDNKLEYNLDNKLEYNLDNKLEYNLDNKLEYKIEQKSSGHWNKGYKWQHVKEKHDWDALLLCGIDYHDIHFWVMTRSVFNNLLLQGKITNQGDKSGKSSEGLWFNYSDVKDLLIKVHTDEQLQTALLTK
jgi:hypothetical protein